MRIVFVYPEYAGLAIGYLSACLKKQGHSVDLFLDPNLFAAHYSRSEVFKNLFSYKKIIVDAVIKNDYDLVCFSVLSDAYGWACDIAAEIKDRNSKTRIIFGGVHPTCVPERVIQEPCVDYVCVGEGEEALVELADCLQHRGDDRTIRNIWAKRSGVIARNGIRPLNDDLDNLPFPDEAVRKNDCGIFFNVYPMITGRGCPYICTYCHNSYLAELYKDHVPKIRRRSVNNVLEELTIAKARFRPRSVLFYDDVFIHDQAWMEEFAQKYAADIGLPYMCYVHPLHVTPKSVDLLERSGCAAVTMGIQSANPLVRKEILARGESNEQIIQALKLLKSSKIVLHTTSIFGLPLSTVGTMKEEITFYNAHRVDIPTFPWLRYYPKTKIVDIALRHSAIDNDFVRYVETGKDYMPFTGGGLTFNTTGAQLINLLYLCYLLPKAVADKLIKSDFYKIVPSSRSLYFVLLLIIRRRHGIKDKYLNPWDHWYILRYYAYFILKRMGAGYLKLLRCFAA